MSAHVHDEGGARVDAAALGALFAAALDAILGLRQVLAVVQLAHVPRQAGRVRETLGAVGAHVGLREVRLLHVPLKTLL